MRLNQKRKPRTDREEMKNFMLNRIERDRFKKIGRYVGLKWHKRYGGKRK